MAREHDSIIIRSWPKVIFLYPVMVASLICGIIQSVNGNESTREVAGGFFFLVLCLNLLVISFEFTRFRTMSIVFFIFGVSFFLLYLSKDLDVFGFFGRILENINISLSTAFYYSLTVYLVIIFIAVYITTRFNYWEIKSNEILHKEGFLGDVRRYPSPNLRMNKEITDVFEFLLLGAGRIVLSPASEKQSIVLEHVLRVNRAEKRIQDLLSSISVEINREDEEAPPLGLGV
ncbi:MAG TPA: hypothetical protein VK116_08870 [Planctomycetota bacterium]|nr:hypothetical protein [Planctomycetota bacterium]